MKVLNAVEEVLAIMIFILGTGMDSDAWLVLLAIICVMGVMLFVVDRIRKGLEQNDLD